MVSGEIFPSTNPLTSPDGPLLDQSGDQSRDPFPTQMVPPKKHATSSFLGLNSLGQGGTDPDIPDVELPEMDDWDQWDEDEMDADPKDPKSWQERVTYF